MSYKSVDFTKPGGLYVYQDTFRFMQEGYTAVLDAIAKFFGDKVIIQGVTAAGGGTVTDGWASVNGELLPIVGNMPQTYLKVTQMSAAERNEQFDNGTQQVVYSKRDLRFTNVATGTYYTYADFVRLPFESSTILDALNRFKTILTKTVLPEAAVIIDGCVVSNVAGGNCDISAGIVIMDGTYVISPARIGAAYPAWLKPDATYVTADPGGTFVKFDYETSQRYKHVMKRFMHESGEVVMSLNPADQALFDVATGLGKWKWLGWKLSEDMRGRVPVGIDVRTADPGDDVWDANYDDVNNQGGEKKHTLTEDEMPSHIHDFSGSGDDEPDAGGTYGGWKENNDDAGTYNPHMLPTGGDLPHENRQPYNVVMFIERL